MKAVVVTEFGGPEVMKLMDVPFPKINSKQVLIRAEVTSVNFADIKARYGKYHGTGQPPFIPGLDVAGIVEDVGDEVKQLSIGQRVIAFPENGSYSEYVVADEQLTYPIPENIDFEMAAACPIVSFTSYKLLADVARLQEGESVLIHSITGGIGMTATQIAKILGASCVIGTVGNMKKIDVALKSGANHAICYKKEDFAKKVNEITNGKGVDVILDPLSGHISENSLACLAPYGRLVNFGNSIGEQAQFKTSDLHSSCRSVLGFSLGTTRKERPYLLRDAANHVLRLLANDQLNIHIGKCFSLSDASEAHNWLESRNSVGKILLKIRS